MYERKDALHQRAKREGYRSRAAYKLLELQRRTHILRRGNAVVDLGAWPGGWLQVASELVGAKGKVVGVDLASIDPLPLANVTVLREDVGDPAARVRVRDALGRPADVVLSDLAPKLTGIAPRDAAQAAALAEAALGFAEAVLAGGGSMVMKTFGGSEGAAALTAFRERFQRVRQLGLDATRKGSSELYLLGTGYRPK